ncbi:unnamed protein product [Acanthoscelides obtectus]|uniref:Uncharacterized protein n=1 Tax=Acanthoscelides obtectus TaxID=200917 RepID=A0A9P0QBD0_ACAOB|nr:unnamed protein product [Acanthoscelides obtectus]CAK1672300.1 hypothetical protein AOBTE_LOCUS28766 [Acanthoscelides obtectus]
MILTIYVFKKRKIILILSFGLRCLQVMTDEIQINTSRIPGFPTRSVWLAKSRFPTVTPSR